MRRKTGPELRAWKLGTVWLGTVIVVARAMEPAAQKRTQKKKSAISARPSLFMSVTSMIQSSASLEFS
jgi:hypothetical protein